MRTCYQGGVRGQQIRPPKKIVCAVKIPIRDLSATHRHIHINVICSSYLNPTFPLCCDDIIADVMIVLDVEGVEKTKGKKIFDRMVKMNDVRFDDELPAIFCNSFKILIRLRFTVV